MARVLMTWIDLENNYHYDNICYMVRISYGGEYYGAIIIAWFEEELFLQKYTLYGLNGYDRT